LRRLRGGEACVVLHPPVRLRVAAARSETCATLSLLPGMPRALPKHALCGAGALQHERRRADAGPYPGLALAEGCLGPASVESVACRRGARVRKAWAGCDGLKVEASDFWSVRDHGAVCVGWGCDREARLTRIRADMSTSDRGHVERRVWRLIPWSWDHLVRARRDVVGGMMRRRLCVHAIGS
jgi:hypothetical protein